MLPAETHARLRRLARRRGIPLARLIRDALTDAAGEQSPRVPSLIGAVSEEVELAVESGERLPPITPPVSDVSDSELERLRRRFATPGPAC